MRYPRPQIRPLPRKSEPPWPRSSDRARIHHIWDLSSRSTTLEQTVLRDKARTKPLEGKWAQPDSLLTTWETKIDGSFPQRSNTWVRDPTAYCANHKCYGHKTKGCRLVKDILVARFASGELKRVELPEAPPKRQFNRPQNIGNRPGKEGNQTRQKPPPHMQIQRREYKWSWEDQILPRISKFNQSTPKEAGNSSPKHTTEILRRFLIVQQKRHWRRRWPLRWHARCDIGYLCLRSIKDPYR